MSNHSHHPNQQKMAAQLRVKLQPHVLRRVRETTRELGRGSYGVVIELRFNGNQCTGKKLRDFHFLPTDTVRYVNENFNEDFLII